MKPFALASLTALVLVAAPAFAQDAPAGDPKPGETPETPGDKQAGEMKKTNEEVAAKKAHADAVKSSADEEAKKAAETAKSARGAANAAKLNLENAEKAVSEQKAAAAEATKSRDAAKAAAEAEGAAPATKAALEDAEAALSAAEAALKAAQEEAETSKTKHNEAETKAVAAEEAAEAAKAKAEEAAADHAEADAKVTAAKAAEAAMKRIASRERSGKVPTEELALRIKPMDQEELKAEADAWQAVLKTRATAIAYAEIAIRHTEGEEKQAVLDALTKLRDERTALVDRLNLVLKAYEARGGDTKAYDQYIAAATGLTLDVKDASALWATLSGWVKSPEGGLRWAANLVWFLGTIFAFRILGGIVGSVIERGLRVSHVKTSELLKNFLVNVVRKSLSFVGVIVALSMLEVNIGPLVAAMGGASLVLGFALQGTLSNFAAGVMILMYRPYDLGDVVSVCGVTGKVSAMTLVSTSLITPDNQEVIVPNSSIWGGVITNITAKPTRRVDIVAGIGYEDDIPKAEATLLEIVTSHEKVLAEPAPQIAVKELADSSVNFVVRPWCKTSDYWDVFFDLQREIKIRFDKEGISIPFPQTDVHVHQVAPAGSKEA